MKKAGVVRQIDKLGRCVIPMEMRRVLGINEDDPLEITREGNSIIITKYTDSCVFCGSGDSLVKFSGKMVCKRCKDDLADI